MDADCSSSTGMFTVVLLNLAVHYGENEMGVVLYAEPELPLLPLLTTNWISICLGELDEMFFSSFTTSCEGII